MKLPVMVRLGGFHLLKSYLGSIGYIMEGSGIEEMIKLIYPGCGDKFIGHILSGGAYYKALRCHFLIDAVIVCFIMKDIVSKDELSQAEEFLGTKAPGRQEEYDQYVFPVFQETLEKTVNKLLHSGRTPKLWMQYHGHVTVIKTYVRAERLNNFNLHLSCVAKMLPTYSAAGHINYGKGARLYLELITMYEKSYPQIMNAFFDQGFHTVRYSTREWGGVWTDLAIEQRLMKPVKSSGGLKGGRLRDKNAHKLWCLTIDHMAEINEIMSIPIQINKSNNNATKSIQPHVDTRYTSMSKDTAAFNRVLYWIQDNNPFDVNRNMDILVSFSFGHISLKGGS